MFKSFYKKLEAIALIIEDLDSVSDFVCKNEETVIKYIHLKLWVNNQCQALNDLRKQWWIKFNSMIINVHWDEYIPFLGNINGNENICNIRCFIKKFFPVFIECTYRNTVRITIFINSQSTLKLIFNIFSTIFHIFCSFFLIGSSILYDCISIS